MSLPIRTRYMLIPEDFSEEQLEAIYTYMEANRTEYPRPYSFGGITAKQYLRRFPQFVGIINLNGKCNAQRRKEQDTVQIHTYYRLQTLPLTWQVFTKLQLNQITGVHHSVVLPQPL